MIALSTAYTYARRSQKETNKNSAKANNMRLYCKVPCK